jgi:hypothetical protein
MRRQHRPYLQVVFVTLLRLLLQERNVGEQEISQRPHQALAHADRIPVSHNTKYVSPLAQVLGAALDPAAALQFGREDFGEVLANAVAN